MLTATGRFSRRLIQTEVLSRKEVFIAATSESPPPFGSFLSKSAIAGTKNQIGQVMNDRNGMMVFEKFLNREFSSYFNATSIVHSDGGDSMFQNVVDKYERPSEMTSVKLNHSASEEKKDNSGAILPSRSASLKAELEQRSTIANMMVLKAWPHFLQSDDHKIWKANSLSIDKVEKKEEEEQSMRQVSDQIDPKEMTFLEKIDKEFEGIVKNQPWIVELLESVDNLPICVSIATARKMQQGFPLIYVNRFFEVSTGYSRAEILGENCRFLQKGLKETDRSEPESVARLSTALGEGRQVKVAITNYRKDGSPFMNLLALKPIFDSDGEYAFVVGIQFDIGENHGAPCRLKMLECVLNALPDLIES